MAPPGGDAGARGGEARPPPRAVDFRSDTVTRPTAEMRRAMAEAAVGDDVWGDDPTVLRLQREAAAVFGKEAGLFVPSGTMGNLCSLMAHCHARGSEIIVGSESHICHYEQGGCSSIAGIHSRQVPNEPDGTIPLPALERAVRTNRASCEEHSHPLDDHFPVTRVICLENTHNRCGARALPAEYLDAVGSLARERGIKVHLDGARVMNAAVALGVSPKRLVQACDSVSVCLSKGLGAPAGSVVVGEASFITKARRARKALGGSMRQSGVLAAPGLLALHKMPEKLVQDHKNAQLLADMLLKVGEKHVKSGLLRLDQEVDGGGLSTNMVYVRLSVAANPVISELGREGFLTAAEDDFTIRFVLHHEIKEGDVRCLVGKMVNILDKFENPAAGKNKE